MLEGASLAVARAAVRADAACRALTGRRLRGVGRVLRLTRGHHVIRYRGLAWSLHGPDAASYFMMLAGRSNEPETGIFLRAVAAAAPAPLTFVDVGANFGEFLLDLGRETAVAAAVGFEPNPRCVAACRESIRLNRLEGKVRVVAKAASDRPGRAVLHVDVANPLTASLVGVRGACREVETTTLDEELGELAGPAVLLVDVEGAEPLVLRGGRRYTARALPIVVFEHNATSRSHHGLAQVRDELPAGYEILRLRGDGRLDRDLSRTWNCVAVHPASPLAGTVAPLVEGAGA